MVVGCCVLDVGRCVLFIVCCLLFVDFVRSSLRVVCCLRCVVLLLVGVGCLMFDVC